ncbi:MULTISPECIES: alpha/beta fold hydrolase [unclassified Rhodococcus (in: high G+C Gram-positive bacteria)]|uniref:alpha/beta hydrolase n=1 Tax=Rhodococcus sp. SJ-3 TaxID=3454628 RepID=UPI003F7A3299
MPFFDGAAGRIHYRTWNIDDASVGVVFAHGFRQHTADYHRFAAGLGARGIALWGIDLAGHGLSEGEPGVPGSVEAHATDLFELTVIAEDAGIPLVLMGHSLGAASALTLLRTEADRFRAAVLCGLPRSATRPEFARALARSRLPVLAVHGLDDRLAPVEPVRAWAMEVPNLQFDEYPDAGHDLLHEPVRRAVTRDIAEFVLDVTARP